MAEQHTRPPDMSPTELPQPSVGPAGCYHSFFSERCVPYLAHRADRLTRLGSQTDTYAIGDIGTPYASHKPSEAAGERQRPSIEDLLKGAWRPPRSSDPVDGVLGDRLDTQTLGLSDLLTQIRERVEIYQQHFYELEQAKLDLKNVRHRWTDPIARHGEFSDPELVSDLQEIDAQQRQERLSCWKDVAGLRQLVPEHWRQYLAAMRQDEWNRWGEGP